MWAQNHRWKGLHFVPTKMSRNEAGRWEQTERKCEIQDKKVEVKFVSDVFCLPR